jgi:hypothetical protein
MDKKRRLTKTFDLQLPDRPPILGGWLAAPEHIQTLTGCSEDDYWSDPFHRGLEAERVLGTDGDYRSLLGDVLACGVGGLQGFQRECGMDLEWIVDLRTRDGDPLLIFGPLAVTTTLPHGTPEDVRAEVHRAMDLCRDKASLVFFTSNTINPDVPLENIQAYWRTVLESQW